MMTKAHRRCRISSLLTCLIAWLSALEYCDAQPNRTPPELVTAIDKLVEKAGITVDTPGVAILLHQPGRLHFAKGYGLATLEQVEKITPQTMFELASVSKTFTATATLILHDRGKLSIQDDIRKYLPELPEYRPGHPIRIRDLLQHTSGLPDYMSLHVGKTRHHRYSTNEDFLELFARQQSDFPLSFPTGQKYEYNNTNYLLLATIIERVSHEPFGRFLREELFQPIDMEHTFVFSDPKSVPDHRGNYRHAIGYEWNKRNGKWVASWGTPPARQETMLTVGDGSIWTNLDEMAKWDAALRAGRFLKAETWKLALSPSKTRDGQTNPYGLGWSVYYEDPKSLYGYGHDGSWGGFRTSYYRYLNADRTTVILSNRGNLDTDKLWTSVDRAVEKHFSK